MKKLFIFTLVFPMVVSAQEMIYRCGNEYTNTVTEAQAKHCKRVTKTQEELENDKRSSAEAASMENRLKLRDRYNTCLTEASKAPTDMGLQIAVKVCKERYGVSP